VVREMKYWDAEIWHHNYEFRDCARRKKNALNIWAYLKISRLNIPCCTPA
jgi:hypothetical protein